jgi:hypothetical protein
VELLKELPDENQLRNIGELVAAEIASFHQILSHGARAETWDDREVARFVEGVDGQDRRLAVLASHLKADPSMLVPSGERARFAALRIAAATPSTSKTICQQCHDACQQSVNSCTDSANHTFDSCKGGCPSKKHPIRRALCRAGCGTAYLARTVACKWAYANCQNRCGAVC